MHKHLGDWYRTAGIGIVSEDLPKRGQAIADYQVNRTEVAALARLFYGLAGSESDFSNRFRTAFHDKDPGFPMTGNEHEMAVLAGAQLIEVIEASPDTELSDLAALSLICPSANNLRAPPPVPHIPERAAADLSDRQTRRCEISDEGPSMAAAKSAVAAMKLHGEPWGKAAAAIECLASDLAPLRATLSVVNEETNMLWWLFSGWSRDLNKPWKSLKSALVPLIAAKEAADLTQILPGPAAMLAFLDRVIRSSPSKVPARILLSESVNSTPLEWRKMVSTQNTCPDLQPLSPIIHAISLSSGAPENNAWLPHFEQSTHIAQGASLAPTTLAYQLYQEILLHRAWAAAVE